MPIGRAALALAMTVVASLLAGVVAAPVALANDEINHWQPYVDRDAILASDADVIFAIGQIGVRLRSAPAAIDLSLGDGRFVAIAHDRIARLPADERASHPLAIALHNAEFYDELRAAIWSLRLIPRSPQVRGDHRALDAALYVVVRYRDTPQIQRLLDLPVAATGGWTEQPNALPETNADASGYDREFDRLLVSRLRTLMNEADYEALRGRMAEVIELVERQQPATLTPEPQGGREPEE